jgi:hypothetical protein
MKEENTMRNNWVKFKEERFQKHLSEYTPELRVVDYPAGNDNQLINMRGMTVNELLKHIEDSVPVEKRDSVVFDRENYIWGNQPYVKGGDTRSTRHQFMELQVESDTPTDEFIKKCQDRAEWDVIEAKRKISHKRLDEKNRVKEIERLELKLQKLKRK